MALYFLLLMAVLCGTISSEKKIVKRYAPLDKIGGGVVLREIKEEGPNSPYKQVLMNLDKNALRYMRKRNFDEIDRAGFRSMGKRNFDEIDRAGFRSMGKRNFDEIDRAGFQDMEKKNFDEIDRAGFGSMRKRNFDEIDSAGFRNIGKRNFDEIDRAGFRSMGKRNFDETEKTDLQRKIYKSKVPNGGNFDDIEKSDLQIKERKNLDNSDNSKFQNMSKKYFNVAGRKFPNINDQILLKQKFDVIDRIRDTKKRSYKLKENFDD